MPKPNRQNEWSKRLTNGGPAISVFSSTCHSLHVYHLTTSKSIYLYNYFYIFCCSFLKQTERKEEGYFSPNRSPIKVLFLLNYSFFSLLRSRKTVYPDTPKPTPYPTKWLQYMSSKRKDAIVTILWSAIDAINALSFLQWECTKNESIGFLNSSIERSVDIKTRKCWYHFWRGCSWDSLNAESVGILEMSLKNALCSVALHFCSNFEYDHS